MPEQGERGLTVTVVQAARMLGISRGLAYQMAREGKIPTVRFGKRIIVPRRAIELLLEDAMVTQSCGSTRTDATSTKSLSSCKKVMELELDRDRYKMSYSFVTKLQL